MENSSLGLGFLESHKLLNEEKNKDFSVSKIILLNILYLGGLLHYIYHLSISLDTSSWFGIIRTLFENPLVRKL